MRVVFLLLVAAAGYGQEPPPTREEVGKAYRSKVAEHGARILFWERRTAAFTIRSVRGWEIRFKHLADERSGPVLRRRYQAIAKKTGECNEYAVTQVIPTGPPPQYVKPDVHVDDLGRAACK